jgi:hypothetical protein
MSDNGELHVVFGTGPVSLAVMDELVSKGKRVRMVNRSGRASVPEGVEVVGGDDTDKAFAREASEGASVVYFALNPPYDKWAELFPGLQAGVLEGAANAGAKLVAVENLYMYGLTGGWPLTEDLHYAPNTRKGTVRARMSEELMEAPHQRQGASRYRAGIGLLRAARASVGCRRAGLRSGRTRQKRPGSRGPRPATHLHLRTRHRQRAGHLGRTRGGPGTGLALTQPRNGHDA